MYDSDLAMFFALDPAGQGFSPFGFCGNNPIIYVDKDGRWFGLDDLFVTATSFIIGYVSHGLATDNWGEDALLSGGIAAGASWLAYNTGGLAASFLYDKGTAGYQQIIASAVGNAFGGSFSNAANQLRYEGNININGVLNAGLSGFGGGLLGGVAQTYTTAFTDNLPFGGYTVSHLIRQSAYQIGANVFSGRKIFENF